MQWCRTIFFKKIELSFQRSTFASVEDEIDSQPFVEHMPSDLDIWTNMVGKKKEGVLV